MVRYWDDPNERWVVSDWRRWVWLPIMTLPGLLREGSKFPKSQLVHAQSRVEEFRKRCDLFRERYGMAKPKQKESWQTDWIHVDMSPEQKGEYRAWDFELEDVLESLGGYLSGGYKLTCNYNSSNSTYQASLICNGEKEVNEGRGVSGYAATMIDAIRVVTYKVVVMLPNDWKEYEPPGGNDIG